MPASGSSLRSPLPETETENIEVIAEETMLSVQEKPSGNVKINNLFGPLTRQNSSKFSPIRVSIPLESSKPAKKKYNNK